MTLCTRMKTSVRRIVETSEDNKCFLRVDPMLLEENETVTAFFTR